MKWDNACKACTWTQKIACTHLAQVQSNRRHATVIIIVGMALACSSPLPSMWLSLLLEQREESWSQWLRKGSGGTCWAVGYWAPPTPTSITVTWFLCLQTGLLCKTSFKGFFKPLFYHLVSTIPRFFSLTPVSPIVKQYLLLGYLLQPDKKVLR